ncbi:right-handed parallel beta-helix repeat-containing protein [Nannocystis sp. ILAH1]|uniref:right-handed parallel beta-helix repeat-containing protein n=1 Tax=unclassified Nannocystis TaxID=2627009 RepID=UPI00226D4DE4|nr:MULTISPECIES: right-handed parallel beta-helix repeat-containing protein [unclassified Nannocystis]MCY0986586.1 right-handed parallel beta-helix repeat-containing protein [Nannocystis sp. ILAH1]MCY1071466.1 right-handed parallel beta-helix repeat-containing protein [Nannocystis sp. RBIL2]
MRTSFNYAHVSTAVTFAAVFGLLAPSLAQAATLTVGADKQYKTVKEAVGAAKSGDVIEIDPGEYVDDISSIKVGDLTIRGVGDSRPHLRATVPPPNKKGIFVVEVGVGPVTVENIEFSGSKISEGDGNNGAGIRAQGTDLTVRNCYFHDNQNGILAGDGLMTIEYSEFAYNGEAGYEHNVYIGTAPKFVFRGNYSHHVKSGHAVKSRALENHIVYNRLMEEADGNGSALIDLPQGGLSYVIGNLIQKGPMAENKYRIVFYKGEGGTNPDLRLFVSHNTFVNDGAPAAVFVEAKAGTEVNVYNNLFVGPGTPIKTGDPNTKIVDLGNLQTEDAGLVDRSGYDYHLLDGAPGIDGGEALDALLIPDSQYVHPSQTEDRPVVGAPDIGAYEFGVDENTTGDESETGDSTTGDSTTGDDSTTAPDPETTAGPTSDGPTTGGPTTDDPTTGADTSDGDTGTTGSAPTTEGNLGTTDATGGDATDTDSATGSAGDDDGGCGCRNDAGGGPGALLTAFAVFGFTARRRRR